MSRRCEECERPIPVGQSWCPACDDPIVVTDLWPPNWMLGHDPVDVDYRVAS